MGGTKNAPIARAVDAAQGEAALHAVEQRLKDARDAIAQLLCMENARPDNLHEDDDYLRRMIKSVQAKRRKVATATTPQRASSTHPDIQ